MATGTVKWFDPLKGFGFIGTDGGPDVLIRANNVPEDYKGLVEGDRVQYDIVQGTTGLEASNLSWVTNMGPPL